MQFAGNPPKLTQEEQEELNTSIVSDLQQFKELGKTDKMKECLLALKQAKLSASYV